MRSMFISICSLALISLWSGALAEEACSTYNFDKAHSQLRLVSENAFWRIQNSGPDDVVLYVLEDQLVINSFAAGEGMTFFGDTNYTYLLILLPDSSAANVKVCRP
ncbi:MAG: hypothetical protein JXR14_07720 [Paracoccaceae bacterium]